MDLNLTIRLLLFFGSMNHFSRVQDGQFSENAFRVLRQCAITGEKTLPVLRAAYIKPPKKSGQNETRNGLLLRADVDILFRRGYLTVTPGYRVEVSIRIKEDYENGRDYYARQGQPLVTLPADSRERPENNLLRWHNENVYLG